MPLLGVLDEDVLGYAAPLLSFKPAELSPEEAVDWEERFEELREGRRLRLFLHDWAGLPLEERMCAAAEHVYCGNHEIEARVRPLNPSVETLWAPGLVLDDRVFEPAELSVFSFGMAHKVNTTLFRRLRQLLDGSGKSYSVFVSNANHETATLRDAQLVFEQMQEIFPRGLYFMGNLSDVAVYNHLIRTTFFAAFFRKGVRANNTSVASAMEHGAVVITNLDEHSPPYLRHLDNVIDLDRCDRLPSDPLVLKRISVRAMETARAHSWEALLAATRAGRPAAIEAGER